MHDYVNSSQPNVLTWITFGKIYVTLFKPEIFQNNVCKSQNTMKVCVSQNTMEPFFLCYALTTNEVLLVPSVVLVIIYRPSSLQDFLSINNPGKIIFAHMSHVMCHVSHVTLPQPQTLNRLTPPLFTVVQLPKLKKIYIETRKAKKIQRYANISDTLLDQESPVHREAGER